MRLDRSHGFSLQIKEGRVKIRVERHDSLATQGERDPQLDRGQEIKPKFAMKILKSAIGTNSAQNKTGSKKIQGGEE